jgi:hypothetical protein|tara:strand:- start:1750 stop:1923 length:174 start_codon:yes stop_codon:yes gene_type:complete
MKLGLINQRLIDTVIDQIKEDVGAGDFTAIDEMLKNIDQKDLRAYLPEETVTRLKLS